MNYQLQNRYSHKEELFPITVCVNFHRTSFTQSPYPTITFSIPLQ